MLFGDISSGYIILPLVNAFVSSLLSLLDIYFQTFFSCYYKQSWKTYFHVYGIYAFYDMSPL